MPYLNALPRFLLTLPFAIRLCIAVLCVGFFLILYMTVRPAAQSTSILAIPLVIVAWMFRKRGVYLCIASMLIILWIYYSQKMRSIFLTVEADVSFFVDALALTIIGLVISSQRASLDLSNAARLESMRACEQQQQLNRIKDRFLQNVNHELRTPLTAVSGYIELLLEHGEEFGPEARASFLKNALYCCEELQLLVNNVLDTLHIDNQREHLSLEVLSVAEVVREVLEHTDPRRLQEYPVSLDIPEDLLAWANIQYVRQILRNLLSNAFKYAPLDTPVTIRAACHREAGEEPMSVCISVQDAGPGIPPADIPLLFGQFVRLQRDLAGKVRGTGLGLYISKQLVESMGGRIWVESTGIAGQGSCFSFTLRAAVDAAASTGPRDEAYLPSRL